MIKTTNSKPPEETKRTGLLARLRELKPKSQECVVLETAADYASFSGSNGWLRKKGMAFTCRSNEKGQVLVWRTK